MTSRLTSSSLLLTASVALVASLGGLWLLGPPKQLKDRLKGPDESQGEKDKVMDLDVYGEAGWWWSDPEFALLLVNSARIPYFDSVWKAKLPGEPRSESKYVDVGCGGGTATEALANLGYKIVGVDPSEGAIEQGLAHAKEAGISNVDYQVG
jgi:2-polyprenyl-6-hydroxyphenyl methylase/3-demethylubiquinone-9 3-methyltransferase